MSPLTQKIKRLFERNRGIPYSGERIARAFRISRAAVWKHIQVLRAHGYLITGTRNKGYLLSALSMGPDLTQVKIAGVHISYARRIGSTQICAKKLAVSGVTSPALVVAGTQSGGYGRFKRRWVSPAGGLWFSLLIFPRRLPGEASAITLLMGIAVAHALSKRMAREKVYCKWPNDIIIRGKKVCGILTEMQSSMDRVSWAVIGVGINVNNPVPAALSAQAVSLQQVLSRPVSISLLLKDIVKLFLQYERIFNKRGWKPFKKQYNACAYLNGKRVTVHSGDNTIVGTVTGIDDLGGLVIRSDAGPTVHVNSGEVIDY